MTEIMICESVGINWTWYCEVKVENGFAVVEHEYRLHKYDAFQGANDHPKANHFYEIIEKQFERKIGESFPPRIAIGINIDGFFYPFEKECPRFTLGMKR